MRFPRLPMIWRVRAVLAVLAVIVALGPLEPAAEKIGSRFQIALPLLAWGCEAMNGSGPEYLVRYLVMLTALHGTKQALGDTPINERPNGGLQGFPSGHTATAVFGASSLVQTCLVGHPVAQGAVLLAAGITGASRIASGWHDLLQVVAGALLGWGCDRALRRPSRRRRRLGDWVRAWVGR